MGSCPLSRRDFLKTGALALAGTASGVQRLPLLSVPPLAEKPVVSIVKIKDDRISYAVEQAIDLLGGLSTVAADKHRILLKPNLVAEGPHFTTKPSVIHALATLMKQAGKEVYIGEGSAFAVGFNVKDGITYRTRNSDLIDRMQAFVFKQLGYTDLAEDLGLPLINLHAGELVEVPVPGGLAHQSLTLHRSLVDTDLLCSVPMMKTHVLASVTLGMKNLIGLYPGPVYYAVRSWLHDRAAERGSPGAAYEIVDMVRANKLGLVVVDGTMAMEGNGPSDGTLVKMDVIIAGTNPLATDMVAARVMGFQPTEVPTFTTAIAAGLGPASLGEIEIRGETIVDVERAFVRPTIYPWPEISPIWGVQEI